MIFAAGRGTRLGSMTRNLPKALIEVGGVPLLEIVLRRLRESGVREVIINVHHFAEQIAQFLAERPACGMSIALSREDTLLDTGGGLKHAGWFFSGNSPFLVHNVDVLSDIDLRAMVDAHVRSGALATLAVKTRPTARPLIFDADGNLCGRCSSSGAHFVRAGKEPHDELGFCGIHVISPALLEKLSESGAFSIVDSYLRLAGAGEAILAHHVDTNRWRDCGRPADLRPLDA